MHIHHLLSIHFSFVLPICVSVILYFIPIVVFPILALVLNLLHRPNSAREMVKLLVIFFVTHFPLLPPTSSFVCSVFTQALLFGGSEHL